MNLNRKVFTAVIAVVCLASPLAAATRIAIVADGDSPTLDLLTAKFSSIPDVELLERREIRGILKEQSISAATLDSKNAFALGKLLKADLFAVLECDPKTNKPFGFIVFDAKTGVRYWDSAIPSDNPEKTAEFASKAVDAALKKRALDSKGKLKYVSLLSLRNVDLPVDKDPFCHAVGALLLRILGNSANFAVLDRSHLDYLNKERNLPGMRWTNKLLISTNRLTIEAKRILLVNVGDKKTLPNDDMIDISLYLGNVKQGYIRTRLTNPLDAARELSKYFLIKKQSNFSNIEPDRKKEAKRFVAECEIALQRGDFTYALESIETACALNGSVFIKFMLFKVLKKNIEKNINSKVFLQKAAMGSESEAIQLQTLQWLEQLESLRTPKLQYILMTRGSEIIKKLQKAQKYFSDKVKNFWMRVYTEHKKFILQYYHKKLEEALLQKSIKLKFIVSSRLLRNISLDGHMFNYEKEWQSLFLESLNRWSKLIDEHKRSDMRWMPERDGHCRVIWKILTLYLRRFSRFKQGTSADSSEKEHFIKEIKLWCRNSSVGMFRKLYQYPEINKHASPGNPVELAQKLLATIMDKIRKLPADTKSYDIAQIYEHFFKVTCNDTGHIEVVNMRLKLCDFMLSRNELFTSIIKWSLNSAKLKPDSYPTCLRLIAKAFKVIEQLDQKQIQFADSSRSGYCFRLFLTDFRSRILRAKPKLRKQQLPMPWKKTIELITVPEHGYLRLGRTVFNKKRIYVLCGDKHRIFFKVFTHDGRFLRDTGSIPSPHLPFFFDNAHPLLHESNIFLKVGNDIFTFPTEIGDPWNLTEKLPLPSGGISCFCVGQNTLYLVIGSPMLHLIACDLKTGILTKTIVSAERKSFKSPFDNRKERFYVNKIIYVNATNSLILGQERYLWIHNLDNDSWRKIGGGMGKTPFVYTGVGYNENITLNGMLQFSYKDNIFIFNPKENRFAGIYEASGLISDIPPYFHVAYAPLLLFGDWIWFGTPFSRVPVTGGNLEYLNHPDGDIEFNANPTLQAIDSNTLMVGNLKSIWLLKMITPLKTDSALTYTELTPQMVSGGYFGPSSITNNDTRFLPKNTNTYKFTGSSGRYCRYVNSMTAFFRKEKPSRVWLATKPPKGMKMRVDKIGRRLIISGKIPLMDGEYDRPFTFKFTIAWENQVND